MLHAEFMLVVAVVAEALAVMVEQVVEDKEKRLALQPLRLLLVQQIQVVAVVV
jgi:hypothetical protein